MLSNFIFDNVLTIKIDYLLFLCVVICFQILSLTTFLQFFGRKIYRRISCDLLSNFIFDNVLTIIAWAFIEFVCCDLLSNFIFDNVLTIPTSKARAPTGLWFAFKFYLWQRSYNSWHWGRSFCMVVICFQILSLTTFLQYLSNNNCQWFGCDLLSNFIFDNVLTIRSFNDGIRESCDLLSNFIFDNVLTIKHVKALLIWRCDLLSNFIFDNVLTIFSRILILHCVLWFAFKFYLWQRSYNFLIYFHYAFFVVICFQILSLTTFLQSAL